MIGRKSLMLILLVVPFLLFMSAEEGSDGSHTMDFVGKLINFLLLFGGLAYVLRKPLGNFFQGRSESLGRSLQEAKESRKQAADKLTQVQTRLEKLDEEVEGLRREAEAEGQSLNRQLAEEAKQSADRLRYFANQEIEMLTHNAIREIKEYTASLAADLAQRDIQDRLTEEFHLSLIDKSIDKLEKLHEESSSDT